MTESNVDHPQHYNQGSLEVIDIIQDQLQDAPLDPFEGGLFFNIIKYILRAPYKDGKQEDLEKAAWYLNQWIEYNEDDDADLSYTVKKLNEAFTKVGKELTDEKA